MYNKIMVPLDGSELAECVLPHVEAIAKGCGVASVVFVRAIDPVEIVGGWVEWAPGPEEVQSIEKRHKSDAEAYLKQVISRIKLDGVNIKSEVVVGKAAESLAEYAVKNDVDLIVIASHGRSGISRWIMGSVAERLIHSACVPVLVVRSPGCKPSI